MGGCGRAGGRGLTETLTITTHLNSPLCSPEALRSDGLLGSFNQEHFICNCQAPDSALISDSQKSMRYRCIGPKIPFHNQLNPNQDKQETPNYLISSKPYNELDPIGLNTCLSLTLNSETRRWCRDTDDGLPGMVLNFY